jgi:hypothetical protein
MACKRSLAELEEKMQQEIVNGSSRKAAMRRARRQVLRPRADGCLPPWHDALAVFLLTNANEQALVQYIETRPGEQALVQTHVTDAYVSWKPEDLLALEQQACDGATPALTRATKFVDEWKLADWIRKHNSCHGVTPTVESMWKQRESSESASCSVSRAAGLPRPVRARQCVRQFCRR